jgi:hypothetical protein
MYTIRIDMSPSMRGSEHANRIAQFCLNKTHLCSRVTRVLGFINSFEVKVPEFEPYPVTY